MKDFDIINYDERYFKWHRDNTRDYAIKTMNWYIQEFKPKSIIDYGCGIGAYLESALINDIYDIKGFDIGGDNVKKFTDEAVIKYIEYTDCTKPISTKYYDCVISLETGEHIETESSEQFVKNICNSTKRDGVIIFSAAQPGQSGTGHINCQEKIFWKERFLFNSFVYDDLLTEYITDNWSRLGAPIYIKNNLMIFKYKND